VTHTAISSLCQRKKKHMAVAKFLYGMIKRKLNRAAVRKIWTKISRISINVFLQKLLVAARYQVAWIFKHVQIGSKWPFKFDITTRYDTPPKQVEVVPISAHFCLKNEFIRKLKMRPKKKKNFGWNQEKFVVGLLTRMIGKIERWNYKINSKLKYDCLDKDGATSRNQVSDVKSIDLHTFFSSHYFLQFFFFVLDLHQVSHLFLINFFHSYFSNL